MYIQEQSLWGKVGHPEVATFSETPRGSWCYPPLPGRTLLTSSRMPKNLRFFNKGFWWNLPLGRGWNRFWWKSRRIFSHFFGLGSTHFTPFVAIFLGGPSFAVAKKFDVTNMLLRWDRNPTLHNVSLKLYTHFCFLNGNRTPKKLGFVFFRWWFFSDSRGPWDENHHEKTHHLGDDFTFPTTQPANLRKSSWQNTS